MDLTFAVAVLRAVLMKRLVGLAIVVDHLLSIDPVQLRFPIALFQLVSGKECEVSTESEMPPWLVQLSWPK